MSVIDRVGEVHNGRTVVARAPDIVTRAHRTMKRGKPHDHFVNQRTVCWTVRCLTCSRITSTTWQGVRLKGCFHCRMKALRASDEQVAATSRLASWRKNASVRDYSFDLTLDDVMRIMASPCHYCGVVGGNVWRKRDREYRYNGPDRVDNARGYDRDNVVPCCGVCNRAKGDLPYEEFVAWIRRVSEHQAVYGEWPSYAVKAAAKGAA